MLSNQRILRIAICCLSGFVVCSVRGAEIVLDLAAFEVLASGGVSPSAVTGVLGDGLERDVRVDLQSRGGSRYQTDVTIRGGIFEGTGVQIGGLSILDPQTGHYGLEIPIDPRYLAGSRLLTGAAHALNGFNSTAGTLSWDWADMESGTEVRILLGSDAEVGGSVLSTMERSGQQMSVAISQESGDGSVEGGDYNLEQVSGRWVFEVGAGNLSLFGGHLSKAYGWPGMYTGNAGFFEFETYAVSLVGMQWEAEGHRMGGYWRYLEDDYEYNRFAPNAFFEHTTQVWSVQGDGHGSSGPWDWQYRWVITMDRIIDSTSLRSGRFSKRTFGKVALGGGRTWQSLGNDWRVYGGLSLDSSDEESTILLPHAGLRWGGSANGYEWLLYTEISESSRVPGYTALNSAPRGLFGGNADLGRESATQIEAGWALTSQQWHAKAVLFQRRDRALVDWVYAEGAPSARVATAVDGHVNGLELFGSYGTNSIQIEAGYALLDKEPEYASGVGGSFYYLNYAQHRLDIHLSKALWDRVRIELGGSWRRLWANPLRTGPLTVQQWSFGGTLEDWPVEGLSLKVSLGNVFDQRFERVPGTPGAGREFRMEWGYRW